MGRMDYLQRSLAAQFFPKRFNCPNCGQARGRVVQRKYVITQLRRCSSCSLLFRTPTDSSPEHNRTYYENDYTQGFTTDMPSTEGLRTLTVSNFAGTEKDYSYYIGVLGQLGVKPGARLFDFGCSWGYGSYQFARAGYSVTSFEIAPTRRRYGIEKLGVSAVDDMDRAVADSRGKFDCFFSAHVIEHVPCPRTVFQYARDLLRDGGIFVSFTPNGSAAAKAANADWDKWWGDVHPNFIDESFLDRSFAHSPRVIGTTPVADASLPEGPTMRRLGALSGPELFFAARSP